jgi:F-type H+-transporting ATPase subunit b
MRTCLLMVLSAILLLFLAGPSFAAHAEGGGGDRNIFEGVLDLSIWTLVVFFGLLLVLGKFAWKPMLEGLDKRERDIASAVEEAKKAKDEAVALHQQMTEIRQKANDEARQLVEEARKSAEELAAKRKAQADEDIARDRDRLRREIAVARDQALKEIWGSTVQIGTTIASKIVRRQLNPDDQRGLLDEALGEMKQAVDQRRRADSMGASA